MIRLLAICTEDPELILGGMGRHVRELYRAMARRGDVEIDLLTVGPGMSAKQFEGYTKHRYSDVCPQKPPIPGIRAILQCDVQLLRYLLALAARGKRWDLIHAHEWSSVQVAHCARDAFRVPIVSTMHLCMAALRKYDVDPNAPRGAETWDELDLWIANQEGKLLIENSELILCSDSYVRIAAEFYPLNVIGKQATMIYNGIDRSEWNPDIGDGDRARSQHCLGDKRIALFVGRIATMKGIEYLLDAVEDRDVGYQIVVAGEVNADNDSADKWHVTRRLRRMENTHRDRFRWIGFQRDRSLKDLYAAADVVVMPSTHEPFGIVALEAMACGVPLIATAVDGLGEIVRGGDSDCAQIIEPRSGKEINGALERLFSDRDRWNHLRAAGLARVAHFDWSKIADQTVGVYKRAIQCMHS